MGRFSLIAAEKCSTCGADVDFRFVGRHQHHHLCDRDDVDWDEAPNFTRSPEFIAWYGTCEICGRRVFDSYVPEEPLFDAASDEELAISKV